MLHGHGVKVPVEFQRGSPTRAAEASRHARGAGTVPEDLDLQADFLEVARIGAGNLARISCVGSNANKIEGQSAQSVWINLL
jgi:hypothetical protein